VPPRAPAPSPGEGTGVGWGAAAPSQHPGEEQGAGDGGTQVTWEHQETRAGLGKGATSRGQGALGTRVRGTHGHHGAAAGVDDADALVLAGGAEAGAVAAPADAVDEVGVQPLEAVQLLRRPHVPDQHRVVTPWGQSVAPGVGGVTPAIEPPPRDPTPTPYLR